MKKLLLLLPFLTACSGHVDPDCFSDYSKTSTMELVNEIIYEQAKQEDMLEEYKDLTMALHSVRFKGKDEQTKQVWCEAVVDFQYKDNPPTHREISYTIELTEHPKYHYFNVELSWTL